VILGLVGEKKTHYIIALGKVSDASVAPASECLDFNVPACTVDIVVSLLHLEDEAFFSEQRVFDVQPTPSG
jgi:hypothetical protein